jgi:CheY-like chemotaxis protein
MNAETISFHNETFLIADDDPQTCMLLERVLMKAGLKSKIANNGLEAFNIIKSDYSITVAIVDIRMPKLDGYELVKKAVKIRPDIIYIAYTADVIRVDKEKCREIGFYACLSKPLLPSILLQYIQQILLAKKSSI